jgi:hypothetical protein
MQILEAGSGRIVVNIRVDEFRFTPPGGQARTADHPQNGPAQHSPRVGRERKFNRQIRRLGRKPGFLEDVKLEVAIKNGRWVPNPPAHGPATGGRTAPMLFSGRLKRRCNGGHTVTENGVARRNAVALANRAASMSVMKRPTACAGRSRIACWRRLRSRAPQSSCRLGSEEPSTRDALNLRALFRRPARDTISSMRHAT